MTRPMQLIICTFDATGRAEAVKAAIQAMEERLHSIKLGNIAIVQKTPDGQINFRETKDIGSELGQIAGTVVGGISWFIYAFAGAFGPVAGRLASARTDEFVHRLVGDAGFPDEALYEVGQRLDAGSSALITLVTPEEQPLVVAELVRLGGHIVEHTVAPEIVAQLTQQADSDAS